MDILFLLESGQALWSPLTFALLVGLAVYLVWAGLSPVRRAGSIDNRLQGYLGQGGHPPVDLPQERRLPFAPIFRSILRFLSRFAPKRNYDQIERQLLQAGRPGNLTVLDFFGLRLFSVLAVGGGYFLLLGTSQPFAVALRNALVLGLVGYLLPSLWLRRAVRKRQEEIVRALPDALDMLTIGVEAGLAFESALLRVGEKWDNALTREFRRVVGEMRVGTPRREALERMVARVGADDVTAFVAVLVQSSQLGLSIAQVLRTQADQMRIKRRQRAEELARQASVKIVIVLVFLIFPSLFIVILGPAVPRIMEFLGTISGTSF